MHKLTRRVNVNFATVRFIILRTMGTWSTTPGCHGRGPHVTARAALYLESFFDTCELYWWSLASLHCGSDDLFVLGPQPKASGRRRVLFWIIWHIIQRDTIQEKMPHRPTDNPLTCNTDARLKRSFGNKQNIIWQNMHLLHCINSMSACRKQNVWFTKYVKRLRSAQRD